MSAATSITVRVPLKVRRRPGQKTVVTPIGASGEKALLTRADPALVKALARAFRYQRHLDEGRVASVTELAAMEGLDRSYVSSILRLTLLAPQLVQAVLDGRLPSGMTATAALAPFPHIWADQGEHFAASDAVQ